jgi:hypothetical protein
MRPFIGASLGLAVSVALFAVPVTARAQDDGKGKAAAKAGDERGAAEGGKDQMMGGQRRMT